MISWQLGLISWRVGAYILPSQYQENQIPSSLLTNIITATWCRRFPAPAPKHQNIASSSVNIFHLPHHLWQSSHKNTKPSSTSGTYLVGAEPLLVAHLLIKVVAKENAHPLLLCSSPCTAHLSCMILGWNPLRSSHFASPPPFRCTESRNATLGLWPLCIVTSLVRDFRITIFF